MNKENIEMLTVLNFPSHYISSIEYILKKHDPFLIVSPMNYENKYSFFSMAYSSEVLGQRYIAHIDRNIFKYCFDFLNHQNKTLEQQKLSISIIVLLSLFDTKFDFFEDILELYDSTAEKSMIYSNIINWNKLICAINSDKIMYFLNFIETGKNELPNLNDEYIDKSTIDKADFSPNSTWEETYIHILTMAIMQKNGRVGYNAFAEYYQWCIYTYKFDLSCLIFSIAFFSSNMNYKKIYKSKEIIRNISWDLSRVSDWYRSSQENLLENKVIDVLATNDNQLKKIGKIVEYNNIEEEFVPLVIEYITDYYCEHEIPKITSMIENTQKNIVDVERRKIGLGSKKERRDYIIALEKELIRT